MQSRDVVGGNVAKIAALFPQCVTERPGKDGRPVLAIDFDKLRAELSDEVLEEGRGALSVHVARQASCLSSCQRARKTYVAPLPRRIG